VTPTTTIVEGTEIATTRADRRSDSEEGSH
jgi:hypothetical protein